jgi:hypothetical protein
MSRPQKFSNAQIEQALRKCAGIQTAAASALEEATGRSCSRQLISKRVGQNPRLRRVCDEVLEESLDIAENELIKGVKRGDASLIKFYLETRGKQRGYTRRHEQQPLGADGKPVDPVRPQALIYIPDNGRDPELVRRLNAHPTHTICVGRHNGRDTN